MSLDIRQLASAMQWCILFLESALGDQRPPQALLWPGAGVIPGRNCLFWEVRDY